MPDQDTSQATDERPRPEAGGSEDRPMPGSGRSEDGADEPVSASDNSADAAAEESAATGDSDQPADEPEHEQEYVDRENIDFDPDDGLYTGTAVNGGTKIPGPHDQVDDVEPGDEDDETVADE